MVSSSWRVDPAAWENLRLRRSDVRSPANTLDGGGGSGPLFGSEQTAQLPQGNVRGAQTPPFVEKAVNPMTPETMEALISAAGMTAFAEDCDRPLLARRGAPRVEDEPEDADTLERVALGL